jgi:RHS repeat-associated protein
MRHFKILCLLSVFCFLCLPVFAQDDPNFETGLKPFGSYHGGNIDTISLLNGDMTLDIPLISYPQRGGKLKLDFVLHYLNVGTYADTTCSPYLCTTDGPRALLHGFAVIEKGTPSVGSGSGYFVEGSDRSVHTIASEATNAGSPYQAVDGSGFHLSVSGTNSNPVFVITDPDGSRYTSGPTVDTSFWPTPPVLPSLREDTNGNQISYSTPGSNTFGGYVDTLGRAIPLPTPSGILMSMTTNGQTTVYSTTCPSPGVVVTTTSTYNGTTSTQTSCNVGTTQDYSGCSGPLPITSATLWNPPGLNSGTYPIKFCYVQISETLPFSLSFCFTPCSPYVGNELQSVVLPNGTAWTFQYTTDGNADLAQVTFPTGGTLAYTWTSPALFDSTHGEMFTRGVATRTLNPNDGVTPSGTSTYTYGPPNPTPCSTVGCATAFPSTTATTVADPAGNSAVHTFTTVVNSCPSGAATPCPPAVYYETRAQYMAGSVSNGTVLKTVNTTYSSFTPYTSCKIPVAELPPFWVAVFPTQTTSAWSNGQENEVQYSYDNSLSVYASSATRSFGPCVEPYGKVLTKKEYDYGNGAPGPLLRTTTTSYLALSNSSYLANNLLNLSASVQVTDGGGTQRALTLYAYDAGTPVSSGITTQHDSAPPAGTARGNLTSVSRWLNTSSTYLISTNAYFDTGELQTSYDPKGNPTTYAYSSTYAGAYPTTVTNALGQSATTSYDFNTGLSTSTTDPNNQTTSYTYDNMLRTTQISYPDTGQTTFSYPNPNQVNITEKISSSANRLSYLLVDGLGRKIRQAVTNGESLPYDEADTCYDALGRVSFKSYPFQDSGPFSTSRSCGSSELGDSFAYDALSRATSVTHSDGSVVSSSYAGRATSVLDEGNGTQRLQLISQVNGLGRLTSICEVTSAVLSVGISGSTAPAACGQDIAATGFLTTYAYDPLDNLTSVAQGPLGARTFVYDSLSRLTSAANPESGTTTYTFDADGNVITKIDARGITTCFGTWTGTTCNANTGYDALNRVLQKTYSDGTLAAYFYYDTMPSWWGSHSASNAIGRKTAEGTSDGSNWHSVSWFSYDPMGRVANNSEWTPQNTSTSFPFSYTYDLLGDVTSSTNGAGVTLTNSYNIGARLTSVTSSLSDANHPGTLLSGVHYGASGLASATLGNGIAQTRTYDARLRLNGITDGSLYTLTIPASGGYAPNGDILAANDSVNGNWTYAYDAFNRLAGSNKNSGQVAYSYAYDRFGNRWSQTVTAGTGSSSSLAFTSSNRIVSGSGVTYDAAGDTTNDGTTTYTYDAEGRIATAVNGSSGTSTYQYDAEGRRTEKVTGGATTDFLYDLSGHEIASIASTGLWNRSEVYSGGRHLATYSGGAGGTTYFIHADWLGTERARSNVSGTSYETCTSLAFGDGLSCSGTEVSPMHFTGKEHDTETSLENFGARYDASSMGRFMSPDPSMGSVALRNPQTWNRYPYTLNNPLVFIDPTGLCWVAASSGIGTYDWMAQPNQGQTCFDAVASDSGGNVKVYGDYGPNDITTYKQNEHHMINVRDLSQHHDSNFDVANGQAHPEEFLDATRASALFNVAFEYGEAYPSDGPLVFTAGSTATGEPAKGANGRYLHQSHWLGKNIDLRYMGWDNQALSGDNAVERAEEDRTRFLQRAFAEQEAGLGAMLTGDQGLFGLPPISAALEQEHGSHMHFQSNYPAAPPNQ